MANLISRAAAIDAVLNDERIEHNYGDVSPEGVIKVIESLPAVDAVPVEWMEAQDNIAVKATLAIWQKEQEARST